VRKGEIVMAPDRLSTLPSADDVLSYWRALGPQRWFEQDAAVDAEIRDKFHDLHAAATEGLLGPWENNASGALAPSIRLDQFPRNIFRGGPAWFAADPLARAAAGRAIERGFDLQTAKAEQLFFYLPYLHSETLADQERCLELCRAAGDEGTLKYA